MSSFFRTVRLAYSTACASSGPLDSTLSSYPTSVRASPITRSRDTSENRTSVRVGGASNDPVCVYSARDGFPWTSRFMAFQILENENPSLDVAAGAVS
jgi:hypothetical protein